MARNVFERFHRDRTVVPFTGTSTGVEPLSWGEKAILQDMRDSGNQFSMGGRLELPAGATVADAAARVTGLIGRHAALRMRLVTGADGALCQEVAGAGELDLEQLTVPDDVDRAGAEQYAADLMDEWPAERFDFERDWPLRLAVLRHRGECLSLVWVLSHLVADLAGHLMLLDDLIAGGNGAVDPARPQLLDVARSEREPAARQASTRAMRYWESQLRHIPARTFGEAIRPAGQPGERYLQVRFTSPAAHLAMLAIARRTATDASRVALAVIATAIARTTGVNPLTFKMMVNNRFRPGLAEVIAPVAQNVVMTIDAGNASVDEVVQRARAAAMSAGMRAYYDPDDLRELSTRLDGERGYPAAVTCRVNDQRAALVRTDEQPEPDELTPDQLGRRREQSVLTWLGPRENMHEQVNLLIEPRSDVLSLHLMWDGWSLSHAQVEAVLRSVEEVAVAAAFDPAAPAGVPAAPAGVPAPPA